MREEEEVVGRSGEGNGTYSGQREEVVSPYIASFK